MAKAFEITLSSGEVIYASEAFRLHEILTEIGGSPRFTIKKTEIVLHELKLGKKFTAKFKDGEKAEIRVVEHSFAVVFSTVDSKVRATSWLKGAVDYIKGHGEYIYGSLVTKVQDGKRWWVVVDGVRVFWTRKEERANLIINRLV